MNNKIKHPKGDRILLRINNILLGIIVLVIVGTTIVCVSLFLLRTECNHSKRDFR